MTATTTRPPAATRSSDISSRFETGGGRLLGFAEPSATRASTIERWTHCNVHQRARENFGSSRIDPDGLPLLELNGFIVLARADSAAAAADVGVGTGIRTGPRGANQAAWNRRRAVRQRPEGLPRRAAAAGAICGSARLLATTAIRPAANRKE